MTGVVDQQNTAATSTKSNLLVIAPPGCGKTELLAMRAVHLVEQLGPGQKILALTFTNRARANLGERLETLLGRQRFLRYVEVRNFHGHAADIIQSHGRTLGLDPASLTFPSTKTLRKALQQFSSDRGANAAAQELLGQVKRRSLSDAGVMDALTQAGDALAVRVERERVASGVLHYDDLLRHAQRLLSVPAVANLYHQRFEAVLVDEFQDLSPQQLDVALRSCIRSRTFAGDPLQGIFSWAGAMPEHVQTELTTLCGDPVELTVSYRSSPAVLAMLNSVAVPLGANPLTTHDPDKWPEGGASAALVFPDRAEEAKAVFAIAKRLTLADPALSVGVITRAGTRRTELDKTFAASPQVPCRRWDLAIDDPKIRDRIRAVVAVLPKGATVADTLHAVLERVDTSDVDTQEDITDAFDAISAEEGPSAQIRPILARYRHGDDEDLAVGPGVHLLNAHTGKGQQFDWVFICGVEDGQMPHFYSRGTPEEVAEEKRVLLVMLSRARHGVVATRARTTTGRFGSYAVEPSPWFAGLSTAATLTGPQLKEHLIRVWIPKDSDAE